jgi:hypothetical protein
MTSKNETFKNYLRLIRESGSKNCYNILEMESSDCARGRGQVRVLASDSYQYAIIFEEDVPFGQNVPVYLLTVGDYPRGREDILADLVKKEAESKAQEIADKLKLPLRLR